MEKSLLEQIETCTNILFKIVIPVILIILGLCFNNSYKEKELREKYIEIAVGILSNKPTPDALPIRNWAINTINHYAETKMTSEAKVFLKEKPLPKFQYTDNINNIDSKKDLGSIQ
jgi:hypothetical protein